MQSYPSLHFPKFFLQIFQVVYEVSVPVGSSGHVVKCVCSKVLERSEFGGKHIATLLLDVDNSIDNLQKTNLPI